jgi:hypothetical protein
MLSNLKKGKPIEAGEFSHEETVDFRHRSFRVLRFSR